MRIQDVTMGANRGRRGVMVKTKTGSSFAAALGLMFGALGADAARAQNFFVEFNRLQCVEETDWDGGSDSDEPYVVFAVARVNGLASSVIVQKSSVFSDVDTGETRGEIRTLWGLNGTAQPINLGQLVILAQVMEHDSSSPTQVVSLVQATMTANLMAYVTGGLSFAQIRSNLARDLHNLCGTAASATGFGNPDDRLDGAHEMVWTAADLVTAAGGSPVERELRFRDSGQDATYDVRFKLRVP